MRGASSRRWRARCAGGKIRYAFSRGTYLGELLMNPLALALLSLLSAALFAPELGPATAALSAATLLGRVVQTLVLDRLTERHLGGLTAWLVPVKDLLQLGAWLLPFVSREVEWHGHRARLGAGTRLLPSRRELAAA